MLLHVLLFRVYEVSLGGELETFLGVENHHQDLTIAKSKNIMEKCPALNDQKNEWFE